MESGGWAIEVIFVLGYRLFVVCGWIDVWLVAFLFLSFLFVFLIFMIFDAGI